jgi:polysaccharide export outer membrane protein
MTQTNRILGVTMALAMAALVFSAVPLRGQIVQKQTGTPNTAKPTPTPPPAAAPSYIIGPDDVLAVTVWRAPEVSGEVTVRPDGKITLSMGNDIQASGLTTEQLKAGVATELKRFYTEPDVFIQVKAIKSRMVYVLGEGINKPGAYPLTGPMTVVQLITIAGGLTEFAHKKDMMLISTSLVDAKGQPLSWKINFEKIEKGEDVAKYNVQLRPGDQLIVR